MVITFQKRVPQSEKHVNSSLTRPTQAYPAGTN